MRIISVIISILIMGSVFGQSRDRLNTCFPKKTEHVYVYDLGDALSPSEESKLQANLKAFKDSTSNVLVVVVPTTLCDYDKSTYTIELGDSWGVGRGDLDNGIVLMVLPKEISETGNGETFIAVGTGLQGAITDLATGRVVDHEMIPKFKQQNYSGGIIAATEVLMKLATGEITEEKYLAETKKQLSWVTVVVILAVFIFFYIGSKSDSQEDYGSNGKRRSRTGPIFFGGGGFSGGGGGSGGGFGGFGGGGFSGGGAGGSW